jgi:hypothetical protein
MPRSGSEYAGFSSARLGELWPPGRTGSCSGLPGVSSALLTVGGSRHPQLLPAAWWIPVGAAALVPPGPSAWVRGVRAALDALFHPSDFLLIRPPPGDPRGVRRELARRCAPQELSRVMAVGGEVRLAGRALCAAAAFALQVAQGPERVDGRGLSGIELRGVVQLGQRDPSWARLECRDGHLHLRGPRSLAQVLPWTSADVGWLLGRLYLRFFTVFQRFLFRPDSDDGRNALRIAVRREARQLVSEGLLAPVNGEPCLLRLDSNRRGVVLAQLSFRPVGLVNAIEIDFHGTRGASLSCAHATPSPQPSNAVPKTRS